MRIIAFVALLIGLMLQSINVVAQFQIDTGKLQQASRYFQDKEYEKASILFKEIYDTSGSQYYFENYLNCLIELNEYDQAEKDIKKEIRHANSESSWYVLWGYLLSRQSRMEEANDKYVLALKLVANNRVDIIQLANAFVSKREFEWAERTYLHGRQSVEGEDFSEELSRIYLYQRNYEKMVEESLQFLKKDENNLMRVESNFRSAIRSDVDNSLQKILRNLVLKQIQAEPAVTAYNRLLIWLFEQEEMFPQALRQAIALDKRTGGEDQLISSLASMAGSSRSYDDAFKAYDYLIAKGANGDFYIEAKRMKMQLQYNRFVSKNVGALPADQLEAVFRTTMQELGKTPESVFLIKDFAHFLAFFQDKPDEAVSVLQEGMKLPRIATAWYDGLKEEQADILVYKGDVWEAVLLYSQLAESNRDNEGGDMAKFKKAKLGYFMGNMSWAQAQLDVLKASTSKLIANDALELSLFISNNSDLDTTAIPLQQFARADLAAYRNRLDESILVLDSIAQDFPYHSLQDDILFRKAKIFVARGNFQEAAGFLEKIVTNYSYDLLADDALFMLAGLYANQLNQQDKAEEMYKKIMLEYPASIYVTEAREKFRKLRGDFEQPAETNQQGAN